MIRNTFSTYLTTFARASSKTKRGAIIRLLRDDKPIAAKSSFSAYRAIKKRLEQQDVVNMAELEPVIKKIADQFGQWRLAA